MLKFFLAVCTVLVGFATARANTFTVTNASDAGPGSLHDAILEANAAPGADEIHFNIPGSGVQKIYVNRIGLPEITDPLAIDGYTQPGASPNTRALGNDAIILIHLDGQNDLAGPVNGLVISAGNSIVRGLSITGIPARVYGGIPEDPPPEGDVILLKTNGGNLIEGNFIGVTPSGGSAGSYHYTYIGIEVLSDDNRIGGTTPASRNVISHQYNAIVSQGHGTVIEGNYTGTDASGFTAVNNGAGVTALGDNIRIGGTAPGAGNLITGSQINVVVGPQARGTIVQGNLVGTKADGSGNLGTLSNAMRIYGSQTLVGGLEPGAGNRISYAIRGIAIAANTAVGNTIFSNVFTGGYGYGIDLGNDEVTRNDLGDSDAGANNLQNFPVVTSVIRSSESTRVIGGLDSIPSTEFTLQFFVKRSSSTGDDLLGTGSVTTNTGGAARFDLTFPGHTAANEFISATATDAAGNTSELFRQYAPVQLANISTRGKVGTGEEILIGGFVIHRPPYSIDDFHKKVLIRALGPSLSGAGLPVAGCLADPYLEVRNSSGELIVSNDNWRSDQAQEIIDSGAPPSNDFEAAVVVVLSDAGYTAQVRGANGGTGLGIVEVFDLDPLDPINSARSGRLVNLSTRGRTGGGDDLLIGGFIVRGDTGQGVVVRAIGPDLTALGIPGALPEPTLELRDASGTLVAFNDDWRDTQEQEIQESALAPNDNRDSTILTALVPGHYTTIIRGRDNAAGLALVEVYALGQ